MKSFKRLMLAVLVGLFTLPGWCASSVDSKKFIVNAMQDGMAEIQLCHLALEKTSDDNVRHFAQQMIVDHHQIDQEIAQLAKRKSVALPKEVSAQQKATYKELAKLSGKEFDKAFMDYNVKDHEKDVQEFKQQAEQGTDAETRAFAAIKLPILSGHLALAKELNEKLKS
jgi:putative membrane protein